MGPPGALRDRMATLLPMAPADRRCWPWSLDNPIRRRLAPPGRELDLLDLRGGETVADLGTGVGFLLPAILERVGSAGRVIAVDPDPQNLQIARSRVRSDPRVIFIESSAAKVPTVPEATVDRVLLSLVLCCMVDKEGALDEAWRVLRPGGRVYVSYPRFRRILPRRTPSLRVTSARWSLLERRRPWRVFDVRNGWLVRRHLLARPT